MAKKTVGYVRLIWTCPRCQTRNPGPNKFCNGCGAPQPEDVQFEQPAEAELIQDAAELQRAKAGPDVHCPYCGARNPSGVKFCGACGGDLTQGKARQAGRVVGAYHAPSGATRPCPACGTPNPLTSIKCSNCGSALPAAVASPAPPPTRPMSSKTPFLIGGAAAALCLLAVGAFALLALKRDEQSAVVQAVAWERAIDVEAMAPAQHSDWKNEVPSAARDLSCELAFRTEQDNPAPVATEVCGTPYTVDEASGYGQVVQDCTYRVYDQKCSYTVDEWVVVDTLRRSGQDLNPVWPEVRLETGQRRGEQTESYTVTLVGDGADYTFEPATATQFTVFRPGSAWTVTVNGLGAVVAVEPAR
jgi:membrane protease subunit (stomatin/prohibitin family)